jgi:hypothetical protein
VFHVRGEHAHAWPEVYIAGAGWVPFEPTPNRGIPFGEAYTGLPEQQENQPPEETPVDTTAPPTTDAPGGPAPTPPPGPDVETGDLPQLPGQSGTGSGGDGTSGGEWRTQIGRWAPLAGAAGLLYLLGVPAAVLARRTLRRRRAVRPADRVRLGWVEAQERAAAVGFAAAPSDTIAERAASMAVRLPDVADDASALAHLVETVEYGPGGADDEQGDAAAAAASRIDRAVRDRTTRRAGVLRWLDPRQLLGTGRTPRRGARRITAPAPAPPRQPQGT